MAKSFPTGGVFGIAGGVLCVATVGYAQNESRQDFLCTAGAAHRVVSVFNRDALNGKQAMGGCRVDYTKDGRTTTIWSSRSSHAYCTAKATALVTRLIEGRYSCRPQTVEKPDESAAAPDAPDSNDRLGESKP